MASKRNLKKQINYIINELFTECLIRKVLFQKEDNAKAFDELMEKLAGMHREFTGRLSHVEPGNTKGFYKKFHEDFNRQAGEIVDSLTKLS